MDTHTYTKPTLASSSLSGTSAHKRMRSRGSFRVSLDHRLSGQDYQQYYELVLTVLGLSNLSEQYFVFGFHISVVEFLRICKAF